MEDFTIIYKANMHSVLVEYGVYTNLEGLYAFRCYGEELAIGTVNSIKKYFGI